MLKNAEGPCCTSPLLMRSVLKGRASPLAATVDGCFERALIHFRPTLDPEPLGLSEELLLGSFLTLRHAPPLSSSLNYTDALPRRLRPKRPARRATKAPCRPLLDGLRSPPNSQGRLFDRCIGMLPERRGPRFR